MLQDAEVGFEQASSPTGGTPELLRQAYAAFFDQLIAAPRAFEFTQAPPTYTQTQAMYRQILKEFHEQIAEWPKTLREAKRT